MSAILSQSQCVNIVYQNWNSVISGSDLSQNEFPSNACVTTLPEVFFLYQIKSMA